MWGHYSAFSTLQEELCVQTQHKEYVNITGKKQGRMMSPKQENERRYLMNMTISKFNNSFALINNKHRKVNYSILVYVLLFIIHMIYLPSLHGC